MERKAQVTTAYRFSWRSPGFLKEAPTLVVTMPDATVIAPALTPAAIHAEETITGIDEAARTLTADGAVANVDGVVGERGDCWLRAPEGWSVPVRVTDIDGATIYVADELPTVDFTTATLQWATHEVAIGSGHDIVATAQRNVDFEFTYILEPVAGVEHTHAQHVLLHVVAQVFDTTLTDLVVRDRMASLAEHLPARAASFNGYIASGLDELVQEHIRPTMAGLSLYEDDILSSERFLRAHLYFTRAAVFDDAGLLEQAEAARKMGVDAASKVMAAIVADIDGDGDVDDPASGTRFSHAGGATYSSTPRFLAPTRPWVSR